LRIAFFGTPDLAVPYLHALIAAGHDVRAVVTQPDRPAGRGRAVQPCAVKCAAQRLGLPLLQPESCRDESLHRALRESGAETGVVVAYGNLLPCEVLDCPERGCVNVHYSLLPKLRGAAPVQRALMAGMAETGVTVQWMSPELDAGEIIRAEAVAIDPDDDTATLFARLNGVGPGLLLHALALVARGEAPRTPQDEAQVTWAPELSKDDCHIDWTASAEQIRNVVRACAPRPGAFTVRGGRRLKVLNAEVVAGVAPGEGGQPGTLAETTHDGHPVVHAGSGAVVLSEVQPEGKQPMSGEEFARGARFLPGERFA
jgi:methionyl-tRNA formyltransferase